MTTTAIEVPVEVLFSRRAHAAICAETLEHHPNETGGILLGRYHQKRWQVHSRRSTLAPLPRAPPPASVTTRAT